MLERLVIKNYAIIDDLSIDFHTGLNIITGETGAGKSILLGALSLILGKRADHRVLFDNNKKCLIRGIFRTDSKILQNAFDVSDLDYEPEIVIHREITSNGRSRAYINETPVPLKTLQYICGHLVDLHQQFDQLDILEREQQFNILDAYAGTLDDVVSYQQKHQKWSQLKSQLAVWREEQTKMLNEQDFIRFQLQEMEEINVLEDEEKDIEQHLSLLTHGENIKHALSDTHHLMSMSERGTIDTLRSTVNTLQKVDDLPENVQVIRQRLESLLHEMMDLSRDIEHTVDDIEYSPERIEELTHRLNTINQLLNKHRINSSAELTKLKADLISKVTGFDSLADDIQQTTERIDLLESDLLKKGRADP